MNAQNKNGFLQLPRNVILIFFSILVMAGIMIYAQSRTWMSVPDYSFGFIMPFFAAFIIYDRWAKIFDYFKSPAPEKLRYSFWDILVLVVFSAMLVCGIFVYLFGTFFFGFANNKFGAPVFILTFGFCFSAFAMLFFAAQKNGNGETMPVRNRLGFVMLFMFPVFGWIISAPLFEALERQISLFLLNRVAAVVFFVMDSLGYVVTLRENVISFPKGQVGVAEACSGIRSLTACLFAGSFMAAVFLDRFWKKALMVLTSMLLAFFNNLLRALFLAFWAYHYGSDSIGGEVHDYAGYIIMGMTIVELFILMPLFQLSAVPKGFVEDEGDSSHPEGENQ